MATEVLVGGLGERRAASTANGGTALTTTATYIQLPLTTKQLTITPRNFATAVVTKYNLNPWLVVLETNDGMLTAPTDYSNTAQDADATTEIDLDSFDTLANGVFLLVGSHLPFRGGYVGVDNSHPNGTTSTLTVSYWNGSAWVDTTATDGTSSSSKTFAVDGLVYWTVPTARKPGMLSPIYPGTPASKYTGLNYYWTRWEVSVALDSDTLVESIVAANRSTAYPELIEGQPQEEEIRELLNGVHGIVDSTGPKDVHELVNLLAKSR